MTTLIKMIPCLLWLTFTLQGCTLIKNDELDNAPTMSKNEFNADVDLLKQQFNPVVLSDGQRKLIVVPELQGRIMTATANATKGQTFGWFNHDYLQTPHQSRSTPIGGADRLMFGPETGTFSQFFPHGKERTTDNLYAQDAIVMQPYNVIAQTASKITVQAPVTLVNNADTTFEFDVKRTVRLFSKAEIEAMTKLTHLDTVEFVGYGSDTQIINTGEAWKKETGLVSIWHLGAFKPSADTTVVIPTKGTVKEATPYFNAIKTSHTQTAKNHVFYKADAQYMNKTGVPPHQTKPIMGAYDAQRNLLTLVMFNISKHQAARYVTASWIDSSDPYNGEIVNVFNDGPDDFGQYFGPFYEMESSSAAFELSSGGSQSHYHYTLHFQGDKTALNKITTELLGITLSEIEQVF
ncbi:DUF6786 family protein [Algibacillus agarilyticus]|uniref:DUF6786 family protein n=1 Tax=Algibacillus agarilyticus TaxID=2234133 RepID=UPI000DCFFAFA|nr:DUF6786 family protein [Algibacillus agarilyticus]